MLRRPPRSTRTATPFAYTPHFRSSPGLDFETKIVAKPEAAALLRKELARKAYKPEPIALGTNTDPYQPVERRLQITRGIHEVLDRKSTRLNTSHYCASRMTSSACTKKSRTNHDQQDNPHKQL